MRNLNNFVRGLLILLCLVPMVGFGACGAFGIFFAAISFSLIPLAYGVAGLVICALLYKLIGKISSK